jgi:hypothetical protein
MPLEDDQTEEERQEGYPVLFDGVRSFRHWYVTVGHCSSITRSLRGLTIPLPGRTTFVNTLCGKTVLGHKDSDDPNSAHVEEGVKIKPVTVGTHTANRTSA